jgi:glycosyltransferase involved in cell wall biosynthesis
MSMGKIDRERAGLMGEGYLERSRSSPTRRLLFYDDSPDFGGHEVMTLGILEYLLETREYDISFIYSLRNRGLENGLAAVQSRFPGLVLEQTSYTSGRLQFLRTLVAIKALRHTRELMRKFRPDCVIAVQGDISLSTVGVLAGVSEGIPTISYIPMAHTRRQRGERILPCLKDAILLWYYLRPHRFITISDSMGSMLRERGARQPIDVVENGVDLSALQRMDKAQARAHLGLPQVGFVAALCGRIEFKQKGHDVLLRALADRMSEFGDWTFLIVGDGPDKQRLELMIDKLALGHKVTIAPWQRSMSSIYSAIDLLVVPSKYEGVPVTILEAMHFGLPIVASAVDAMADLLPGPWLFPSGNSDALADAMLRVRSMNNDSWLENNRRLVETRFTLKRQKEMFARVLTQGIKACVETNQP